MEATIELDGQYRALREEAGALRRDAAVIAVTGAEAAEYLQGQLTNEIEALEAAPAADPAAGAYAALLDRKGHMQGDMRVLRTGEAEILLVAEPEAAPALVRHLDMYRVGRDATVTDRSQDLELFSAIGPAAAERVLGGPAGAELAHRTALVDGIECRAIATDLGVDLLCAAADADALRETLGGAGVAEVSEDAAEICRVESGRPRFGREMTTETIPQEAGINERAVDFEKGCYIGQETVARLHYKGRPNRHLRGLRLDAPASAGDEVVVAGKPAGRLGTAVVSPALGPVALAILRREAEPGARVDVGANGGGEVVELPFG